MRLLGAILVAAVAHCGARTALDERDPADAGGGAVCPPGQICISPPDASCGPGEQLCVTGCPERQDFTPPVCMVGPCRVDACVRQPVDAGHR